MKLTKRALRRMIKEELEEACGIPADPLPVMIDNSSKKKIVVRVLKESDLSNPWAAPSEKADVAVSDEESTAEKAMQQITDKLNQARRIKTKIDKVIKPGLTGRVRPNQRWAAKILRSLGEHESGGLYDEIYNLYNELAELWHESQMEWPEAFNLDDWQPKDRFEKIWIVNDLVGNLNDSMGILKDIVREGPGQDEWTDVAGNNWDQLFKVLKNYKKINLPMT